MTCALSVSDATHGMNKINVNLSGPCTEGVKEAKGIQRQELWTEEVGLYRAQEEVTI